jgi:curli biogenesis system outer membrane secretion channel CsgG
MNKIIFFLLSLILTNTINAQKKVTTSFETIKEQCKDLPVEKRVIIRVARFSVTTNNAPLEFGDNLSTMLTNTLQGVNCYRVLESLKNQSDMNEELNYGESEYAKKSAAPKKGKQLGAQIVVTGEITEYSLKSGGMRVGVLKVGSNKAKIGFVLKMINPETSDVLYSQSINVEGKVGAVSQLGVLGLDLFNSVSSDPAVANACEQGIIKAVEFLASKKDSLHLTAVNSVKNDANTLNETEITLTDANFNSFNAFATLLASIPTYKSVEKSLKSGTAIYTVSHIGSGDSLLEEINKKVGTKYEVTGFDNGKIELKVKQ